MIQTKYIFIVRHGHAGFDNASDKLRNLTEQGQQAVESCSQFIEQKSKDYHITANLCISSDANRTIQTAKIICKRLKISKLDSSPGLYSTVPSAWMDKIIESNSDTLILVGHNPTLSQLVNQLTGSQCYMNPANCTFIKLQIQNDELMLPANLLGYYNNE